MKYLFYLLLILCTGCQFSEAARGVTLTSAETNLEVPLTNPPLEITVFDVGKSDCILIQIEGHTLMIDTARNKNGIEISGALMAKGISSLDYLILTHFDKDHIGGADIILDNFQVDQVIAPNYVEDSKQYNEYALVMAQRNITPTFLNETLELQIGEAHLTLLPAENTYYENANNFSTLVSLTYGEHRFLFTGDAKRERLAEFLQTTPEHYTFVKMPHHGSYNSLSQTFLKTIEPTYAAITCSLEEPPSDKILSLLNDLHTETYLTYKGRLTLQSDGKDLVLLQDSAPSES